MRDGTDARVEALAAREVAVAVLVVVVLRIDARRAQADPHEEAEVEEDAERHEAKGEAVDKDTRGVGAA